MTEIGEIVRVRFAEFDPARHRREHGAETFAIAAGTELLAQHLRWLDENGAINGAEAAANFEQISGNAKAFILKIARAVNTKRPLDASALFGEMSAAWENGMASIVRQLESTP